MADLKRSIIVKNQFNVRRAGGGTHGNSPGDYVKRYAARSDATEDLAPVKQLRTDTYATRYMARDDATEVAVANDERVPELKYRYRSAQKLGGRAFGPGNASLSHDELVSKSAEAQAAFESGHTMLMTVLSFDEEYLREAGVIPAGFHCRKRGDYRGNVDQMKLRIAINEGLERMSRRFDDLDWVGAVQVDTMHVHCHLLLWDRGTGRMRADGEQQGKLDAKDKSALRRGIDTSLGLSKEVSQLSANVTDDRRNVRCFVKRFAGDIMLENGMPQFLLACLPSDKRLWRAGSNRRDMRKANALAREFVTGVLERPDSGFDEVRRDIASYALTRMEKEGLTEAEYRELVDDGTERIVETCVNAVYDVLRNVPDDELRIRTPLLDIMGMEYTDAASLKSDDPIVEFGFKLRSYSSRIDHHRKEKRKYERLARQWESSESKDPISVAMYNFYTLEAEYNAMCMAKYQHFLAFMPPGREIDERMRELEEYGRARDRLRLMLQDPYFKRFTQEGAEMHGRLVYGHTGGRFMAMGREDLLRDRLSEMEERYVERVAELRHDLAETAHALDVSRDGEDGELTLRVRREVAYPFDEVKALDMHHLAYDFPYDAAVSAINVQRFVNMARRRAEALDGALGYLESTGQSDFAAALPVADIRVASELADTLPEIGAVTSRRSAAAARRAAFTFPLDESYGRDMVTAIENIVGAARSIGDNS